MRLASFHRSAGLRRPARVAAAILCAAGLAACAGKPPPPPPPPPPTVALVSLAAAADANPDARGRASPVSLRIYELRSRAAFDSADFFSLYSRDRETLGADLANKDERVLKPGDSAQFKLDPKPDTRFIGVVAAYRDIERANWRAVAEIPPNKTTPVRVRVERNGLALTTQ
ncbi:hypothetical protein GCM10023144_24930 [Pigmentiphaga soli]|uniref:Type VI secretion system lipoprotein TssJ n=1 Tax=Pigmentiphaga soli TaxID=1007095 RepID=A0ABP8H360_9BURK